MGVNRDLSEDCGAVKELHLTLDKDTRIHENSTDIPERSHLYMEFLWCNKA
jgi:hypothetical protein